MAVFEYKAIDTSGREISGIVDVTGEIGFNVNNVDVNMDGTRVNVESIAATNIPGRNGRYSIW